MKKMILAMSDFSDPIFKFSYILMPDDLVTLKDKFDSSNFENAELNFLLEAFSNYLKTTQNGVEKFYTWEISQIEICDNFVHVEFSPQEFVHIPFAAFENKAEMQNFIDFANWKSKSLTEEIGLSIDGIDIY